MGQEHCWGGWVDWCHWRHHHQQQQLTKEQKGQKLETKLHLQLLPEFFLHIPIFCQECFEVQTVRSNNLSFDFHFQRVGGEICFMSGEQARCKSLYIGSVWKIIWTDMHDMRTICARFVQKIPPLLSVIAICANGRRDQQLYRTIGDQTRVSRGNWGASPPTATCVAGKWGKPRNRSWCQRILTICVLFLQSSSTSMGSNAKPNQPMQCKSARCLHIDNASSLLAVK